MSTVIPGIRNTGQAIANTSVCDLLPLPEQVMQRLRKHAWLRGFWYSGK